MGKSRKLRECHHIELCCFNVNGKCIALEHIPLGQCRFAKPSPDSKTYAMDKNYVPPSKRKEDNRPWFKKFPYSGEDDTDEMP